MLTSGCFEGHIAQSRDEEVGCESLLSAAIPGGTVTSAVATPAGDYLPAGQNAPITGLPAFCRATVLMKPTPDSTINVEVWMPRQDWNGRFLGTGNGGGAGSISYVTGLVEGLKRGFAVANTDLGTAPDPNALTDHPERWQDFGYRANHEMTVAGKTLAAAYYKAAPRTSYFTGCSTGGQQALSIAQRYPDDYDGIIAGAAANNRTHVHTAFLYNLVALSQPEAQMSQAQLDMVTGRVLAACAGKDGGAPTDNFLTDPRQCVFDPETLPKCSASADNSCLTAPQLAALKRYWNGPINPRTGERIYAGMPLATEGTLFGVPFQSNPGAVTTSQLYFFQWALGAAWDYKTFDFDRDMDTVDARLAPIMNANDPDLSRFQSRGGKLLMFTGTADAGVPFAENLQYVERVVGAQGGDLAKTQDFLRYYMVPGMGHCSSSTGGKGVGDFGQPYSPYVPKDKEHDMLLKLVDWVENKAAPTSIIATKYADASGSSVLMERPICPYPQLPKYQSGDASKADSFKCIESPRNGVPVPAARFLN